MDIFWESKIPTGISPRTSKYDTAYNVYDDGHVGVNGYDDVHWDYCGIYSVQT